MENEEFKITHLPKLCEHCQSYKDGKCTDCFEPGILYACVNYLERNNDNK